MRLHPRWTSYATWRTLGVALVMATAGMFLAVADEIADDETQALDEAALRWLAAHRTPGLNAFFGWITELGSWPFVSGATLVLCAAAVLRGYRRSAGTLAASVLGIPLLVVLLKLFYARPRPSVTEHLAHVDSASFPSGHSIAATVFFGTLSLLVAERVIHFRRRAALISSAALLVALVALSRMYLGVHYPTDVVGGALVGGAWLLSIVVLAGKLFK